MITFTQENFLCLLRVLLRWILVFYPLYAVLIRRMINVHRPVLIIIFICGIRMILINYGLEYLIADQFQQWRYHEEIFLSFQLLNYFLYIGAALLISKSSVIKTLVCSILTDTIGGTIIGVANVIENLFTGRTLSDFVYPICREDLLFIIFSYAGMWLFLRLFSPLLEKFKSVELKHTGLWSVLLVICFVMAFVTWLYGNNVAMMFTIIAVYLLFSICIILYFTIKLLQSQALFDRQRLRMAVFNSESTMYQIEMTMHLQKEIALQLEKVKAVSRNCSGDASGGASGIVSGTQTASSMAIFDDSNENLLTVASKAETGGVSFAVEAESHAPEADQGSRETDVYSFIPENRLLGVSCSSDYEGDVPASSDGEEHRINNFDTIPVSTDVIHISERLALYRDSLNQMYAEMKYTVYCRNWHLNALLNYYYFRFQDMDVQTTIAFQKYRTDSLGSKNESTVKSASDSKNESVSKSISDSKNASELKHSSPSSGIPDSRQIEEALNYLMNDILSEWNGSTYTNVEKKMYIQCETTKGLDILTVRCTLNGRNRLSRRTLKSILGSSMYHLKMEEQTDGMEIELMLQRG